MPALLATLVDADPSRPFLTWYDRADGARVELSAVTTANWVAKTAGLLRDVLDAEPGGRVGLALPAHWQGAVWALACWTLGAVVVPGAVADDLAVAVVGPDALATDLPPADEVVVTALHPLGARCTQPLPVGVTDFGAEVLAMPDVFLPVVGVVPDSPAWVDEAGVRTHADLIGVARLRAQTLDLPATPRLLTTRNPTSLEGAVTGLLVPLVTRGSLVLVSNADPADLAGIAAEERVDATVC